MRVLVLASLLLFSVAIVHSSKLWEDLIDAILRYVIYFCLISFFFIFFYAVHSCVLNIDSR